MQIAGTGTDTERGWTLYGFQTYYSLLNCGFRLRPAAGTANGVHPVPLGFSRVYVHLDEPFSFDAWMRGLAEGRSFVTTGPMLLAKVDGEWPGKVFGGKEEHALECRVLSEEPLESIELVVNGEVAERFEPANGKSGDLVYENKVLTRFSPKGSSWLAWRCFERRPNARFRFAHTAPWHFAIPGEPLRPRRAEAEWLVERVKQEIERSQGIASDVLIAEYHSALKTYEKIAQTAR